MTPQFHRKIIGRCGAMASPAAARAGSNRGVRSSRDAAVQRNAARHNCRGQPQNDKLA